MIRRKAFAGWLGWGLLGIGTAALAQALSTRNAQGVLVGSDGHVLYTYDADAAGRSACTGPCLAVWPAYAATAGAPAARDFSVITRADGEHQWAFRGKPLYRYAADQKPGEALGDGVHGSWPVLR